MSFSAVWDAVSATLSDLKVILCKVTYHMALHIAFPIPGVDVGIILHHGF